MYNHLIKIAIVGMDLRTMNSIRDTISQLLHCDTEIVDVANSELAIFDMDTRLANEKWKFYKSSFPHLPFLALCTSPSEESDAAFLTKPLDSQLLLSRISNLLAHKNFIRSTLINQTRLQPAALKTQSLPRGKALADKVEALHGTSSDSEQRYKLSCLSRSSDRYDPGQYFYSLAKQAIQHAVLSNSFCKLTLANQKHLLFDPNQHRIYTDMSNGVLKSVCLSASGDLPNTTLIETLTDAQFLAEMNKQTWLRHDADQLLWRMAIQSARGRIPNVIDGREFSPALPVHLRFWPNLTRFDAVPHAQRMASHLIRQPRSLESLAQAMSIDIMNAINFFVAANTIGIAGISPQSPDHTIAPNNTQTQDQSGLLSSIMKRLRTLL